MKNSDNTKKTAKEIFNLLNSLVDNNMTYGTAVDLSLNSLSNMMDELIDSKKYEPMTNDFLESLTSQAYDTKRLSYKQTWALSFQIEKLYNN